MGKINDDVYGSSLIRDGRIMTSDIQDGAVTTEKLTDGSVTSDKLASAVTGSLLPAATSEDKDKVPVVNEDGEWELGSAGGGGGGNVLKVTFEYLRSTGSEDLYSETDYTMEELLAAFNSDTTIVAVLSDGYGSFTNIVMNGLITSYNVITGVYSSGDSVYACQIGEDDSKVIFTKYSPIVPQ